MPNRNVDTQQNMQQKREAGRKGGEISGGNRNASGGNQGGQQFQGGADNGRTHQQNVQAGREGGKLISSDKEHMAEIGQKGGEAYHEKRGNHGSDNEKK